jgi:hypothetical protein
MPAHLSEKNFEPLLSAPGIGLPKHAATLAGVEAGQQLKGAGRRSEADR